MSSGNSFGYSEIVQEVGLFEDVRNGRIRSAYTNGLPFDKAIGLLKSGGYKIISAKKHLELLMQESKESPLVRKGCRVKEARLLFPDQKVFFVKESPAFKHPKEFAKADEAPSYTGKWKFYINDEDAKEALKDSISLNEYPDCGVPLEEITNNPRALFLFEEIIENVRDFLKDCGFKRIFFPLIPSPSYFHRAKAPFVEQLYIGGWDKDGQDFVVAHHSSSLFYRRLRGYKERLILNE